MLRQRQVVYQSVLRPVERRSDGRSRRPAARRLQDPVSQCWQWQSVERVIGHFGFNRAPSAGIEEIGIAAHQLSRELPISAQEE